MTILIRRMKEFLFTPPIKCKECGFWGQPVRGCCENCGAELDGFFLDLK